MKKNHILGLALATLVASHSACSSDSDDILFHSNKIMLTSRIIPSRVNDLDFQSTQIEKGQKVGVTITGASDVHNNVAWTAEVNGSLTNGDAAVYYMGNSEATVTAYHPFNEVWTGTDQTFTVSTDQSTDEKYLASDLLWASTTTYPTHKSVALNFKHLMAKISINIICDEDLSGSTINICNTFLSIGFNPTFGILSDIQGVIGDIKAGGIIGKEYTASAIIVPQTIEKGTKFIKLAHGSKLYYYLLPEKQEFQSGHAYHYTLRIDTSNMENPLEGEESEW